MPAAPRSRRPLSASRGALAVGALGLVVGLAGCGDDFVAPGEVASCLRQEGLSVTRQPGVRPPVDTRIVFDMGGETPDLQSSGFVTYYDSEEDATRNLESAGGSNREVRRRGRVLYTARAAQQDGSSSDSGVVEGCVGEGQAAAEDDDDGDSKKKRGKRRRR